MTYDLAKQYLRSSLSTTLTCLLLNLANVEAEQMWC